MIASTVFKNGHPKMIGDLSSVPVFTTVKSAGTYELSTCTQISSMIPSRVTVYKLQTYCCV